MEGDNNIEEEKAMNIMTTIMTRVKEKDEEKEDYGDYEEQDEVKDEKFGVGGSGRRK
jgi:hypothetical protein